MIIITQTMSMLMIIMITVIIMIMIIMILIMITTNIMIIMIMIINMLIIMTGTCSRGRRGPYLAARRRAFGHYERDPDPEITYESHNCHPHPHYRAPCMK